MTRKDYELLASALRSTKPDEKQNVKFSLQWSGDVAAIANALEADNPRFNRARFLAACGIEEV